MGMTNEEPPAAIMAMARYAIYFVPGRQTDFYQFGAGVLGYDCYTATDLAIPDTLAMEKTEWRTATREPRRYGFHATLKAPFRLARQYVEADLRVDILSFARAYDQIPIF